MDYVSDEGSYLEKALSKPLIEAVCEVCEKRPGDPIEHIANYLHTYRALHQSVNIELSGAAKKSSSNITSPASSFIVPFEISKSSQPSPLNSNQYLNSTWSQDSSQSRDGWQTESLVLPRHEHINILTTVMVHEHVLCSMEDLYEDDDLS